jgi:hypothetical protein
MFMNAARAPPSILYIYGGHFTLANYVFSQGQVFVDEGVYRPVLKKLKTASKFSVLLIANRNKEAQLPKKEKEDVKIKKQ